MRMSEEVFAMNMLCNVRSVNLGVKRELDEGVVLQLQHFERQSLYVCF